MIPRDFEIDGVDTSHTAYSYISEVKQGTYHLVNYKLFNQDKVIAAVVKKYVISLQMI